MPDPRHLRNAPIHEALVDLQVTLPSGFDPAKLQEAHAKIRDAYPKCDTRMRGSLQIELSAEGEPKHKAIEKGVHGYIFKTADQKRHIQFRVDGFTYNWLSPYERWESLRDEAKKLWSTYVELAKPERINRVGLRYINRMSFPIPVDFDEYLTAAPAVPKQLPQEVSSFFKRVVIHGIKPGFVGIITQAYEGTTQPETAPVILDIDVFKQSLFEPDGKEAWETLEELRHFKNKVFFESVTEKALELFA